MDTQIDTAAQQRLEEYFAQIGEILGHPARRASFAVYAFGLFGDAHRKTMEGIAARACPDPQLVDATHQRVHHFITDSNWNDRDVRLCASRYALESMTRAGDVQAWIIDDTGFLKQGEHTVGVQRQYTGTAGKITNCQIGVSLTLATAHDHVPVDFELYVPASWANDPARRAEARIPDELAFETKPQLALGMIRRALANGLPRGTVLADEAYGNSSQFRDQLRALNMDYAVAINATTKVWVVDKAGRRNGPAETVSKVARRLQRHGTFRRCTWRAGSRRPLSARFARVRVVPCHDDGREPGERDHLWLICEWRDGDRAPEHYHLASLPHASRKALVRLLKERWRTERVYQDLKGELGLDEFEGRRFRGWHHHVSIALVCYAFLIAERARRFSPSATRDAGTDALPLAA